MKLKIFLKNSLLVAMIIMVAGCGLFEKNRTFTPTESGISKAQPIDPIDLDTIQWKYIDSRETLERILENTNYPLFLLSKDNFDTLNSNMAKIIRYMKDQDGTIKYYENVIDEIDAGADQ